MSLEVVGTAIYIGGGCTTRTSSSSQGSRPAGVRACRAPTHAGLRDLLYVGGAVAQGAAIVHVNRLAAKKLRDRAEELDARGTAT